MSNPSLNIIPEPKIIKYLNGNFSFSSNLYLQYFADKKNKDTDLVRLIQEELNSLNARGHIIKASAMFPPFLRRYRCAILIAAKKAINYRKDVIPPIQKLKIKSEGYVLHIDESKIILGAQDSAGLFYGIQTFLQLIRKTRGKFHVPALTINDWPEMSIRGTHIDLHNLTPKLSAIKDNLKFFARYKLNTVLISYVDKFKFEKYPEFSHPDAFSKAQLKEVVSLARSLHIELIPVIQSFGHSANVLINEKYAYLREGRDILTQFCPQHPDSFKLFQEMAQEVMEVHDSRYFHIGADETYFLGSCPKCKEVVRRKGKIGLYIDYISKVCDFLISRNKIPLLWDDMLCQSPSKIRKLDKRAVICYWEYMPADIRMPFVFFRNDGWYCNKKYWHNRKWWGVDFINSGRCKDIKELSLEKMKYYKSYLSSHENFRYFNPYPFYRFYANSSHITLACPTTRGGEYGYICPNYSRRLNNIFNVIQLVAENSGPGVITTSWSETLSPDELCLYPFVATAEYTWSPKGVTFENFQEKFLEDVFGCLDHDIFATMHWLGRNDPPLCYQSEDRTDLKEKGYLADRETYKQLLDVRISKFVDNPKTPGRIAELRDVLTESRRICTLLEKKRPRIQKNLRVYHHMILAAHMLRHKTEQALVFYDTEQWLKTFRGQEVQRSQSIVLRLSKLEKEARALIKRTTRLFGKTYQQFSVRNRTDTIFAGELEKIKEYKGKVTVLAYGREKTC